MSTRESKRKGWWRLFVPGAGMPTALEARLPARRPAARDVDPHGADVDALLAEDPALWTDADRATVRAAQARMAAEARAASLDEVLPPDRLHHVYRQTLRWLVLPVALFIALYVWGGYLPTWLDRTLRVLDEVALAALAIALLGMSRRFRYHELTAAAAVATDVAGDAATGPRRLLDGGEEWGSQSGRPARVRVTVIPE